MRPTPPELKWLAEKRARKASEFERAQVRARTMNDRVATLAADLAALDRALTIRDPSLNPDLIGSVNGWQGRYGKRGESPPESPPIS